MEQQGSTRATEYFHPLLACSDLPALCCIIGTKVCYIVYTCLCLSVCVPCCPFSVVVTWNPESTARRGSHLPPSSWSSWSSCLPFPFFLCPHIPGFDIFLGLDEPALLVMTCSSFFKHLSFLFRRSSSCPGWPFFLFCLASI